MPMVRARVTPAARSHAGFRVLVSIQSFHRLTLVSQIRKVPSGAGTIAVAVARLSLLPRLHQCAAILQVRSTVWLLPSAPSKSPRSGRGSSPRKDARREARQEHCPAARALLAAAHRKPASRAAAGRNRSAEALHQATGAGWSRTSPVGPGRIASARQSVPRSVLPSRSPAPPTASLPSTIPHHRRSRRSKPAGRLQRLTASATPPCPSTRTRRVLGRTALRRSAACLRPRTPAPVPALAARGLRGWSEREENADKPEASGPAVPLGSSQDQCQRGQAAIQQTAWPPAQAARPQRARAQRVPASFRLTAGRGREGAGDAESVPDRKWIWR